MRHVRLIVYTPCNFVKEYWYFLLSLDVIDLTVVHAKAPENTADKGARVKMHLDVVADISDIVLSFVSNYFVLARDGIRCGMTEEYAL